MRINEAIYDYLESVRKKNSLTLDQIATESRRFGSTWTPGFISGMKRNATAASLPNLLLLARTIESLTGTDVVLPDLFVGSGDVELTDTVSISRGELRKALSGNPFTLDEKTSMISKNPLVSSATQAIVSALPDIMQRVSSSIVDSLPAAQKNKVESHEPTLSEVRAAKKLSVTPEAVSALCLMKYGQFLDDETASRAGENASPQKRGRETRGVFEELDLLIEDMMNSDVYRAMHVSDLGLAAKRGDTDDEQSEYEAEP